MTGNDDSLGELDSATLAAVERSLAARHAAGADLFDRILAEVLPEATVDAVAPQGAPARRRARASVSSLPPPWR